MLSPIDLEIRLKSYWRWQNYENTTFHGTLAGGSEYGAACLLQEFRKYVLWTETNKKTAHESPEEPLKGAAHTAPRVQWRMSQLVTSKASVVKNFQF